MKRPPHTRHGHRSTTEPVPVSPAPARPLPPTNPFSMQESDLWGWLFSQDPMPQAAANPRSFLLPALGYGRGTDVPSSDNIACAQPPGFGYGIWCTGGGASTFSADSEPHGRQPHRPGKQRETQGTHALAGARETRHCSWGLAWAGGSRKSQDAG